MKLNNVFILGDGSVGFLLGYGLRRFRFFELEWLILLLVGIWLCRELRFFFVFRCFLMFFFKLFLFMNFIIDSFFGFFIFVEYIYKYFFLVR